MRDTPSTLPEPKAAPDSADKNGGRGKTSYIATITPRALASDTLAPFPIAKPAPEPEPVSITKEQAPSGHGRRRLIRIEFVIGVIAVLGVGFLLVPKKVVKHIVPTTTSGATDLDDEDFGPGAVGENSPTAPLARTAEEWVKTASITGVRKTRILINGKVHKLNEPIPPFRVVWTGSEAGTLTFRSVGGSEYFRQTK
jgi:hypothetical protein